ncbi:MAG: translation initiation factor IF-2 N-terminal domain-containing protein, partial [Deltaproteobacteria bacterium]|nr:translation initiation factor IF-2 N-terminal domain-containing protein [Deltaproteobacteria bacterium]
MRVHQLAKKFDLTSKDLLPHLKKLGIEAKNHMSSISEDDVERVKNLLNPPSAEKIVEERIKPTIIRRRRKIVEEPPVEEKVEEEKGKEVPLAAEKVTPPPKEATGVTPAEPSVVAPAKKQPAKEEPESKVKIISKKIVLPEEEEDTKVTKKKRFKKERFSPGKDITKRKFTSVSSKDLQEEEASPGEKAKRYKPSPFRKKKPLSLVKAK